MGKVVQQTPTKHNNICRDAGATAFIITRRVSWELRKFTTNFSDTKFILRNCSDYVINSV